MSRPVLSLVVSQRRAPVEATRLAWCDDAAADAAHERYAASPRGRIDTARGAALMLAVVLGDMLRDNASAEDVAEAWAELDDARAALGVL